MCSGALCVGQFALRINARPQLTSTLNMQINTYTTGKKADPMFVLTPSFVDGWLTQDILFLSLQTPHSDFKRLAYPW